MPQRLTRKFFERDTLIVARELLGKILVRTFGDHTMRVMITDVEAYCGSDDLACHASKGHTPRTEVMFGQAGVAYVYMIYGMYFCLNIVTERKGYPAAVLIRGVKILDGVDATSKFNGPGKICRYLEINKDLNGEDLTTSGQLWLENGRLSPDVTITTGSRINIDYAGEYKDKPWRLYLAALED